MNNKITKTRLNLAEKLAPSISTRVAVQSLRNELVASPFTRIVLDFKKVESISRSAAHEIVMMVSDLTNLFQKKITIENTTASVAVVFSAVTNQSTQSKPKERQISGKTIDYEKLCQPA